MTWSWQNATQNPLQHFFASWNSTCKFFICLKGLHSFNVSQVSKLLSWGNFRLIVDAVLLRWCNNNIFGSPTTLHIVNEKGHPIFDGDWAIMSNQHSQIRLFWGHFQSECFGLSSLETKQTRGKKPRNQVKSTHVSSNGHQCVKRRHTKKKILAPRLKYVSLRKLEYKQASFLASFNYTMFPGKK